MQKKFAQSLNEHNKLTDDLLSIADDLTNLSQILANKGDIGTAEQIADTAEKCANIIEKVTANFEEEHSEELKLLEQVLADK